MGTAGRAEYSVKADRNRGKGETTSMKFPSPFRTPVGAACSRSIPRAGPGRGRQAHARGDRRHSRAGHPGCAGLHPALLPALPSRLCLQPGLADQPADPGSRGPRLPPVGRRRLVPAGRQGPGGEAPHAAPSASVSQEVGRHDRHRDHRLGDGRGPRRRRQRRHAVAERRRMPRDCGAGIPTFPPARPSASTPATPASRWSIRADRAVSPRAAPRPAPRSARPGPWT